jgi:hypothetical protein
MPAHIRAAEILEAVMDLYSKDRSILELDPLYLSQELVMHSYFKESDPPTLLHIGHAQDLIREVQR